MLSSKINLRQANIVGYSGKKPGANLKVRAAAAVPTYLNRDNFNSFISDGSKNLAVILVSHDMCIPCKQVHNKFDKWVNEYHYARFAEIEFKGEDRRFLINRGVLAVPTVQVYIGQNKIKEICGMSHLWEIEEILNGNFDFED